MNKFTVSIPHELMQDIRTTIPWGLRRHLVMAVISLVTDAVRQNGTMILGAIIDGQYQLVLRPSESVRNSNTQEE